MLTSPPLPNHFRLKEEIISIKFNKKTKNPLWLEKLYEH